MGTHSHSLSFLRQGQLYHEKNKKKVLQSLSVHQGICEFLDLYNTFRPLLDQTEKIFHHERKIYLSHFQERLGKLNLLLRNRRGRSLSDHL